MNFSAENASRKWPFGRFSRARAAIITVAALLLALCVQAGPAQARKSAASFWGDLFADRPPRLRGTVRATTVPLPRPRPAEASPRPAEAPAAEPQTPAAGKSAPAGNAKPTEQAAPAAPQPSACRLALTEEIAIAPTIADIHGPGGCGGEDLVRLEAVVLSDKHRVKLAPAAILRCTMASAIADWIRTDMAPLAQNLGSVLSDLDNFDSYECRNFNGIAGAHLSEHGHANALDVRALKLADGQSISLTDRTVPREVRESVLHSVCARFTTVLGPGSDGYHEDHIHLDLMERHNNYKICQWNVWDPLPQVAPLLPAERPDDAPPREVAAKPDTKPDVKPDAATADEGRADGTKSDKTKPDKLKSHAKPRDRAGARTRSTPSP
jgi:hypothetical protein